jgi:class 3 adenylate cyclase
MEARVQQGYLMLADISGFTSFMAAAELEHAHAIVGELLEVIVERFSPLLTLVEFEGDCVYARADGATIPAGEVLLEVFESTYMAFRDRVEAVRRHTTCVCNACRLIPTLDLKFITHYGEYMLQSMGGNEKPVGSAVNLVHRLAKNHVTETQGWRAYALFTAEATAHLGLDTAGMFPQEEAYEHLGRVMTYNLDMAARYRELAAARRILVASEDAHAIIRAEIAAPPAIVWEWLNDPQKRMLWEGTTVKSEKHNGRRGLGARNHCLHGKQATTIQTMVDWKPFDYFTFETQDTDAPKPEMLLTHELTATPGGTHLEVRSRVLKPMPNVLLRIMTAVMLKRYDVSARYVRLTELLGRNRSADVSAADIPAAASSGTVFTEGA